MKAVAQKLGRKIKKARLDRKLTQEELAEKLNISRTHMGHIEQGRREPSLDLLQSISKQLKIKISDILPF